MFSWLWGWISKIFGWLLGLLPSWLGSGYAELSGFMGPTAKYFAYLSGLDAIVPIIIGAYIVRFLIRRIPIIG